MKDQIQAKETELAELQASLLHPLAAPHQRHIDINLTHHITLSTATPSTSHCLHHTVSSHTIVEPHQAHYITSHHISPQCTTSHIPLPSLCCVPSLSPLTPVPHPSSLSPSVSPLPSDTSLIPVSHPSPLSLPAAGFRFFGECVGKAKRSLNPYIFCSESDAKNLIGNIPIEKVLSEFL